MKIAQYLDSTYLKTPGQSGLSEKETEQIVFNLAQEAIDYDIFAVMIRPNYVKKIKSFLIEKHSKVRLGTVIGFHEGTMSVQEKLLEAKKAIEDGADELDFVMNYEAYKKNEISLVKDEFLQGTKLGLDHAKVVKWIIEIAALSNEQIAELTQNISRWAEESFSKESLKNIFVKSSTGFFKTENGKPNGATEEGIKIMLENAGKLPIKAAGGVRSAQEAEDMIALGVRRIGTSSAKSLVEGQALNQEY